MIYSASLSYNPLDIKTISLNETFQRSKNEQNQENGTASETNSHELNTTDNLTSSGTSKTQGNSNSSSYNTASSLNVASDTPQGQISKQQILQGNYASSTSANESDSEIQDFTNSTSNNTLSNNERKTGLETLAGTNNLEKSNNRNSNEYEEYSRIKEGFDYKESKSKLIAEYRKNIINIYERIIEDLNSLFFALY